MSDYRHARILLVNGFAKLIYAGIQEEHFVDSDGH